MSLSVKIAASSIAKDASSIILVDKTGAYNASTNTGGYGGANVFPTPLIGFLKHKYWTDTAFVYTFLDSTMMSAMQASGYTHEATYADGIQHFRYIPLYTMGSGTTTNGSSEIAVTGFDITSFGAGLITHVVALDAEGVPIGDPLEIDWTQTQTAASVKTKTAFTGTSGVYDLGFGVEADLKVLVNKAAEKCIVSLIGKLAESPCTCLETERVLNKLIRWRFAADVKFDSKDYEGSQNMVLAIGSICQASDCNC